MVLIYYRLTLKEKDIFAFKCAKLGEVSAKRNKIFFIIARWKFLLWRKRIFLRHRINYNIYKVKLSNILFWVLPIYMNSLIFASKHMFQIFFVYFAS